MLFDVVGEGKIIWTISGNNISEVMAKIDGLKSRGKFGERKAEYIRSNAHMVYHYYHLDGTENYEKTREGLVNAGFGGYLSGQGIGIS